MNCMRLVFIKKLLSMVEGASIYLEEYTRDLIGQEEQHQLELRKMLKDFSLDPEVCIPIQISSVVVEN